ncbi:uncharacterized protein LOC126844764 [Adelges cooleyi]|uniref:uncharacterized protein LOC126844764 n=1 Tax=Adelges cooleyi TaxID=133065 RepID=UPI00217F8428|nr:uncharacterized protein LOC126844764 [Adelges cooleyi]
MEHDQWKVPLNPIKPPSIPRHTELLLFNDIMEDLSMELRLIIMEFLQVYPFRKFEFEFSNFLKHLKAVIEESKRNETKSTRSTNIQHIAPLYTTPRINNITTSLNKLKKENSSILLKPCTTINEVEEQTSNELKSKNNNLSKPKQHELDIFQNDVSNTYSDISIIENAITLHSQHNTEKQNENNSLASLSKGVGCNVAVELSNKASFFCKENYSSQKIIFSQNQSNNLTGTIEKYLSKWSLNVKQEKTTMKTVLEVTGELLADDKLTSIEKEHNAGIVECRKDRDLIKTSKGIYRLVGNIFKSCPKYMNSIYLKNNGFPKYWKCLLRQYNTNGLKNNLNMFVESPATLNKSFNPANKIDISLTRRGTTYSIPYLLPLKNNQKRKHPEYGSIAECSKNKLNTYRMPLLASTPKKPKLQLPVTNPNQN